MSNPEIARYLEKEHLRDAEENDYHLMEGLIKQHKQPVSNTIDIPVVNDNVNNLIIHVFYAPVTSHLCIQFLDDSPSNIYRH